MFKEKFIAFLKHFTISSLVALITLFLVYWVWYPGVLSKAMGVDKIFWMILIVDVTLGPTLTFAVYKKGKKHLKFDLIVIVLLQVLAYLYGLNTAFSNRPAWLVFSVDRFEAVSAKNIRKQHRANPDMTFNQLSVTGPRWAVANSPATPEEKNELMFEVLAGGPDIHHRPYLYTQLDGQTVKSKIRPLKELKGFNPQFEYPKDLSKWPSATGFVPLTGQIVDMSVLLNKKGEVIEIVDLRPW